MPNQTTDAEAALKKLGQRLRSGWAKKHPMPEQSIQTVRQTVRGEWEQEQTVQRGQKPAPARAKDKSRKPPEPDR